MKSQLSFCQAVSPVFLLVLFGSVGAAVPLAQATAIDRLPQATPPSQPPILLNAVQAPGSDEPRAFLLNEVTTTPSTQRSEEVSTLLAQNADELEDEPEEMAQVTSVSQLTDVQSSDWAFQALQSLVERYGCIVGYPDGAFKGNRALTRYEFAAGVNACLDRVNELIATVGGVSQEDLLTIQKLQEEFAAELATLRGRVDALEARTTELEKNQFSTTTKLFGQVVVGVQGRDSGDIELAGFNFEDEDTNINVINNVQLSLFTQLSDRSLLLTGLQSGGGRSFSSQLLTNDVLLGYEGDTGNDFVLSDLTYRHLLGNNFAVIAGPIGVNMVNVFRGANRVESAGQGPLSRFAQRNPIQNINGDGGGLGFDWQITNRISLQAVYSANRSNDPDEGGLFGGDNGATTIGAQLTLAPTNTIDIALNYVNAYSPSGNTGAGVGDDLLALPNAATFRAPLKTNAFGATVAWRVSRSMTLGAWGGYTNSYLPGEDGNVETVNWMAFLNLPNLGGRGNLGGLYVGQPPRITSSDLPVGRNVPDFVSNGGIGEPGDQPSSTTHIEAFYRIRLTNNISVTPGVIFILNPRNNSDNDNITIGAVRTTFSF